MANRQFVTFYLGEDLFGIDILMVREINRTLDITPVDRAPDFVRGLMNLRGQIVTVLDLGVRLDIGRRELAKQSSCIILKTRNELARAGEADALLVEGAAADLTGLLVDRIGDVVSVEAGELDPPPAHTRGVRGHFIEGVIKLEGRLLIALNIQEVLSVKEELTTK